MGEREDLLNALRCYFLQAEDVSMAFLFGSYVRGQDIAESDLDVAVYFRPQGSEPEWESGGRYQGEDAHGLETERIGGRNVDLLVLNRAPSTIAFEVLRTGTPLVIKDRGAYLRFLSHVSFEAIDFMDTVRSYWQVEQRSRSLGRADRDRLIRLLDFLKKELADRGHFDGIELRAYESDSDLRRNVERWIENIVNCAIDAAKVLLASEKKRIPDTYRDMLASLAQLPGFDEETAVRLAATAGLRNLLAHEYLDLRFPRVRLFLDECVPLFTALIDFVGGFLERSDIADD